MKPDLWGMKMLHVIWRHHFESLPAHGKDRETATSGCILIESWCGMYLISLSIGQDAALKCLFGETRIFLAATETKQGVQTAGSKVPSPGQTAITIISSLHTLKHLTHKCRGNFLLSIAGPLQRWSIGGCGFGGAAAKKGNLTVLGLHTKNIGCHPGSGSAKNRTVTIGEGHKH